MSRRQSIIRAIFWTPITLAGVAVWWHGLANFAN